MSALSHRAYNHDPAPDAFTAELIAWGKTAPDELFALNAAPGDIFGKVKPELGPWDGAIGSAEWLLHRKAVELHVLTVLAQFESDCDWREGVDTSRLGADTPENAEAGAWQISYDARYSSTEFLAWIQSQQVSGGVNFQQRTKFNHPFAIETVARLLRVNTKHNGPLYKGDERLAIRRSLRGAEHSVYPWLSRDCIEAFKAALTS